MPTPGTQPYLFFREPVGHKPVQLRHRLKSMTHVPAIRFTGLRGSQAGCGSIRGTRCWLKLRMSVAAGVS
jgi:hypothetical protein